MPLRDPSERLFKAGTGFSKMLASVNNNDYEERNLIPSVSLSGQHIVDSIRRRAESVSPRRL